MREEIWRRQGGRCYYCDREMTPRHLCHDQADPAMATIDHVIPRSVLRAAKVSMGVENLVYACQQCNKEKGATVPPGTGIAELRVHPAAGTRKGNWEVTGAGHLMWIGGPGTLAGLDGGEGLV